MDWNKKLYWLLSLSLCGWACTQSFEDINTDPQGIDEAKVSIESKLQFPQENLFPSDPNMYQYWRNLHVDIFAGYYVTPHSFGNNHNGNYKLREDFNHGPFENFFLHILPYTTRYIANCKQIKYYDYAAITQIVQVLGALEVTDTYGPMNYQSAKEHNEHLYYDSTKSIYDQLFNELEEAIKWMDSFLKSNPTAERRKGLARCDKLCGGSHEKWIRMANTLRLRMAMRIVKVDPIRAREIAEEAVSNPYGVLTRSDTDIQLSGRNPIWIMDISYGDSRMNASIESILKGYADPRLKIWFRNSGSILDKDGIESLKADSLIVGIRQGLLIDSKSPALYLNFSSSTYTNTDTRPVMRVSEAYFLRAEGALRGWNMGGTAKDLYEEGIRISLSSYGISEAESTAYINGAFAPDGGKRAADYTDYHDSDNNIKGMNDISVSWNESDNKEKKLQRIITQKWIAIYPDSFEAWAEYRRTGYPKLFPVKYNLSGGLIDTNIQIRRLPFTEKEYSTNTEEVTNALKLLNGPDTGGTRLWWDVNKNNF